MVYLPLWKIWVRQLGWLFPIYGKIKFMFQTTNQHSLQPLPLPTGPAYPLTYYLDVGLPVQVGTYTFNRMFTVSKAIGSTIPTFNMLMNGIQHQSIWVAYDCFTNINTNYIICFLAHLPTFHYSIVWLIVWICYQHVLAIIGHYCPSPSKLLLPKAPGFIAAGSLAEAELLLFTLVNILVLKLWCWNSIWNVKKDIWSSMWIIWYLRLWT